MDVYTERVAKIQDQMKQKGYQYLLLGPSSNMFYLTGLKTLADERFQVVLVPAKGNLTIIIPEMYKETAANLAGENRELFTWADDQDPTEILIRKIDKIPCKVAVDEKMWVQHFLQIMHVFLGCQFFNATDLMKEVRVYKDDNELSYLQNSGKLVDKVMGEVVTKIRPGVSERELALFIETRIKELGADDISFKPIVASGPNGSRPHHISSDRRINNGEFITLDFGAVLNGYCSDITRTFCLGKASKKMKEVYQAVQCSNEAGFMAMSECISCEELDQITRNVICKAGFGEFFIHRTGHGIGLDYHEEPYIVKGNHYMLKTGMVFSVEPGIYLPNEFGVRIEDIVALTKTGPVRFNNFSRDLIEI